MVCLLEITPQFHIRNTFEADLIKLRCAADRFGYFPKQLHDKECVQVIFVRSIGDRPRAVDFR